MRLTWTAPSQKCSWNYKATKIAIQALLIILHNSIFSIIPLTPKEGATLPLLLFRIQAWSWMSYQLSLHHFSSRSDVEFVTKVTNDIWVKYFWASAKLSRVNAKNTLSMKFAEFRLEFSQNNWNELIIARILLTVKTWQIPRLFMMHNFGTRNVIQV